MKGGLGKRGRNDIFKAEHARSQLDGEVGIGTTGEAPERRQPGSGESCQGHACCLFLPTTSVCRRTVTFPSKMELKKGRNPRISLLFHLWQWGIVWVGGK